MGERMSDEEKERFWDEFDASIERLQRGDPESWAEYLREWLEWEEGTIGDGLEPEDFSGYFADEDEESHYNS